MNMKFSTPVATFKAQRGGTILGIIIGVLVGLGAALAVAVYVTKVPVPFVNKSPTKATDQDAAEAKKNKDWDPNTPLYGKNPAKANPAASGAITVDPSAVTAPATGISAAKGTATAKAAASAAKADKKANTPDDLKTSADPLGDLAKAKTKTATSPAAGSTPSGADPFTYFVQAGAYRTTEDADAQRAKLGMMGMDAKITEREQSGRTVYRVRVGPFDKKDDAEKAKEKLDGNGLETALVRTQR